MSLNEPETHSWSDNTVEEKNFTFIIKKATITIAVKNLTIYVNGTAPELGTDVYTVTGLADGEVLKTAPIIAYEVTPDTSIVGSVVIKASGAEAPEGGNCNDIVYTDGVLNIKKKSSGGGGGSSGYVVKFETNGGSKISDKTLSRYDVLEAPEEPTREGYTFEGWFTDSKFTSAYNFSEKVTASFTLYAKWVEEKIQEPDDAKKDEDRPQTNEWKNPFADVKEKDWFFEAVKYASENGLMNGTNKTEFSPASTLTRGMLVTVLYRADSEPAVNKSIPFEDVTADMYYANAVIWAKQNGIVNGVTENEFAPDENITREQIATIMFRYAQYKNYDVTVGKNTNILSYSDHNEISEYAIEAMQYAVGSGLIKGKSETTLNPKDFATRAEIATTLQRFIETNK